MNVVVTGAGRRAALVRAFQEAAHAHGGRVIAADCDGLAPALFLADEAAALPALAETDYRARLLDLVRAHAPVLVVPTLDPELPILAGAAPAIEALGGRALVSTAAFVRLVADKWATLDAFAGAGVAVVPSWQPEALPSALPAALVVKPRRGSASQGVLHVQRDQLGAALALVPEALVQPALTAPEMSVDALFDFEGRLLHYVPRRRLRTRAGESIQGMTLDDGAFGVWLVAALTEAGRRGARGPLTLQAFLTEDGPLLSEINARFGGGFPLAEAAGAHYPHWILALLRGEPVTPRLGAYRRGLFMTRHDAEIFTETPRLGEGEPGREGDSTS